MPNSFSGSLLFPSVSLAPEDVKKRDPGNEVDIIQKKIIQKKKEPNAFYDLCRRPTAWLLVT